MKLIEPKVEKLKQEDSIQGIYKIIDEVAGVCYDRHNLHKDSKKFVEKLISWGHMRPLEFATVYLKVPIQAPYFRDVAENPYSRCYYDNGTYYITTNYRVIIESEYDPDDILKYIWNYKDAPEYFFKRPIVKVVCSRAVADEFGTPVSLSSMMKSTRYCKFDDLDICRPQWIDTKFTTSQLNQLLENPKFESNNKECYENEYLWWHTLQMSENGYRALLDNGIPPQQARGVLPMDMATELVLCGYDCCPNTGWQRFLKLRTDSSAHPDAQYLASKIMNILNRE